MDGSIDGSMDRSIDGWRARATCDVRGVVSGGLARALVRRIHAWWRWRHGVDDDITDDDEGVNRDGDGFACAVDGGRRSCRHHHHIKWAHSRIQGAVSRGSGRVRGGVCAHGTHERREWEWWCGGDDDDDDDGGGGGGGVRDVASGVRRGVSEELGGPF